jgi:hypothetical protein
MSVHKADTIKLGNETYDFTPDNATQSSDGLMSSTDKTKIDNLTEITTDEISSIFSEL